MAEEHLACPKCDYDLFGISEVRCPECGYYFEYEALRELAREAEWMRWVAARALLRRAVPAAILATPAAAVQLGIPRVGQVALVAVFLFLWVGAWIYFAGAIELLMKIPQRSILPFGMHAMVIPAGVVVAVVLSATPAPALVLATALVVPAAWILLRAWPELPPPPNTRNAALRRAAWRLSITARAVLLAAVSLITVGWLS